MRTTRLVFDWEAPDGGCVAFIRYKGQDGVSAFTKRLVEEAGVLFLPSTIFRSEIAEVPPDCLRVGFGHADLPEGLVAMRNWIRRNAA